MARNPNLPRLTTDLRGLDVDERVEAFNRGEIDKDDAKVLIERVDAELREFYKICRTNIEEYTKKLDYWNKQASTITRYWTVTGDDLLVGDDKPTQTVIDDAYDGHKPNQQVTWAEHLRRIEALSNKMLSADKADRLAVKKNKIDADDDDSPDEDFCDY